MSSISPSIDLTPCPSWCTVTHSPTKIADGDFHHDGYGIADLPLSPHSQVKDGDQLFVKPSLYVKPTGAEGYYAPQVEIQSSHNTLLALCVDDARQLAEALLRVANLAGTSFEAANA